MTDGRSLARRDIVLALTLAGSLWGLSEVGLNAGMRAVAPGFRAGVLVGVGMLLMGALLAFLRRPLLLVGAALLAVACRQLVVPILHASVLCKANACIAVLLQAGTTASLIALVAKHAIDRTAVRAATAAVAAVASAAAFWTIGLRVAPCEYLLSFGRPGGFAAFLAREGLVWAAFAGVAFPAGYAWGTRHAETLQRATPRAARLTYASSLAIVAGCWILCGFLTAAGY
jgi:hypothetical protein